MRPTQAFAAPGSLGAAWLLRAQSLRFFAVVLALVPLLVLEVLTPSAWQHFNEQLSSRTWALAPLDAREQRIVVVDIDERSVQALGPWPWPRDLVAALLSALDAQGVSLRIVDIVFEGNREGDSALREALQAGSPAVVAQVFSLQTDPPVRSGVLEGAWPAREGTQACAGGATPAWGYIAPATGLPGVVAGHITPSVDPDGAVRRVPGVVCFEGKAYSALVVAALTVATGDTPRWSSGGMAAGSFLRVGEFELPTNRRGELRVSYALPRDGLMAVSAADVLAGTVPQGLLKGVWALVGSTALGAGDAIVTPQGGAVGGVEVHAQLLAAALDHRIPSDPRWGGWLVACACFVVGLLSFVALVPKRPGPALALPTVAFFNLGWIFLGHATLLLHQHLMVPWGTPALFALLCPALLLIVEMLRVRIERERLYSNLSSYLPEAAARKLALSELSGSVQAERREATVMVLDLRNFSAFCEGRSAEESAQVLHRFYSIVEAGVSARGGVVEHLVGDAIVAAWNASLPCEGHPRLAFDAAAPLWREVVAQLPKDASRQSPPLDLGIGIETGMVLVGSFGAARRRTHAILGETVTVAVRLEALTGELAYPILLGPGVVDRLAEDERFASLPIKSLGNFLLAGLSRPRRVHALQLTIDQSALHLVYRIDQDRALAS